MNVNFEGLAVVVRMRWLLSSIFFAQSKPGSYLRRLT